MSSITPSGPIGPESPEHNKEPIVEPKLHDSIQGVGSQYKHVALHEYPDITDPNKLFSTLDRQPEDWKDPLVRMHVAHVANITPV